MESIYRMRRIQNAANHPEEWSEEPGAAVYGKIAGLEKEEPGLPAQEYHASGFMNGAAGIRYELLREIPSEFDSYDTSIYERLFPDEYHYIKEYQENGVREMDIDKIEMLFYGTKELDDKSYDLIVMNNGQIFTKYI